MQLDIPLITIILSIFLTIILALSITFNIVIASSSVGSLIFKHNDEKLLAVTGAQALKFDTNSFLTTKSKNISLKKESKSYTKDRILRILPKLENCTNQNGRKMA